MTLATRVNYSDGSLWRRIKAVLRMRENRNHAPETLERSLDSTLESVDSAEELAVGVAQRAGFDEDDLMKIGMAVRESMVNAVVHGNRYNAHKKVRLFGDAQPGTVYDSHRRRRRGFRFFQRSGPVGAGEPDANLGHGVFFSSGLLWMSSKCAGGSPGVPK